jgi:hypothetical protein
MDLNKRNQLFYSALSISLALMACSPQMQVPIEQKTFSSHNSQVALEQKKEQVSFTYIQPQSFKTQLINLADLKFIKLTLIGDGLTGSYQNEGGYIPLTGGKATASIGNIPIQAGKLRIVTVQGYDANKNPLSAFVGKGYYISQAGQHTPSVTIDRHQFLTGQALEKLLLSDPTQLFKINLAQLQAIIDEATGYNPTTKQFTTDPSLFDAQKLADLLLTSGVPSKTTLQNNTQASTGNVSVAIKTLGGGKFTEALSLEINDPKSPSQAIAINSTSPQNPSFQIAPGSWTLLLKKGDGTQLGSSSVNISANGTVSLGTPSFTVALRPEISSLSPSTGTNLGGTSVTLTGTGFTGATAVKFGSTNATSFTVNSNTSITAIAPAGSAGQTDINVTTAGGSNLTDANSKFSYINNPSISSLSSSSGVIGSSVTLTGSNFDATHGNNTVKFGSATATTTAGNVGSLTVTVPAGVSGVQSITVTTGGNTSSGSNYSVIPDLSSLSPILGPLAGGTSVTLTGTGFTGATAVKFGSTNASSFTVNSNTSITATAPAGSAGQKDITVTTAGGSNATGANAKYTYGNDFVLQTSGTAQTMNGIVFGNSKFVVVGEAGTIISSADGVTWSGQTSGTAQILTGISYGNSNFVAVGASGTIISSADGSTWSSQTSGTAQSLTGITYGNSLFVAVGNAGTVLTSADGSTWTARTSGTITDLYGVTYANSQFVAVGNAGTVLTSADGITWTSRTTGVPQALKGISFGNSKYVAVGNGAVLISSPDAITWTTQTSGAGAGLRGIDFGNGKFIAIGAVGKVVTSTDAVTWSALTTDIFAGQNGITYANGKFVVVGIVGLLAISLAL